MRFYFVYRPEGIPGNDDYGTMSAWMTWASIGLYPMAGEGRYAIGAPSVKSSVSIEIPLPSSSSSVVALKVTVLNASAVNRFVKAVRVNGQIWATPYVTAADLFPGRFAADGACGSPFTMGAAPGTVEFTLASEPYGWNTGVPISADVLSRYPLPEWPDYAAAAAPGAALKEDPWGPLPSWARRTTGAAYVARDLEKIVNAAGKKRFGSERH